MIFQPKQIKGKASRIKKKEVWRFSELTIVIKVIFKYSSEMYVNFNSEKKIYHFYIICLYGISYSLKITNFSFKKAVPSYYFPFSVVSQKCWLKVFFQSILLLIPVVPGPPILNLFGFLGYACPLYFWFFWKLHVWGPELSAVCLGRT